MKRSNKLEIVLILLIFITLFIIVIHTPIIYKYRNDGKLIINEVMPSNKSTVMDSYGDYSDYIEIYNGNDEDINLHNYYLSDDSLNLRKWSFPDITIKANSYLLVFATGKDTVNKGEVHTNFKISNKGEVLTLADTNAKPLSRIYFNETKSDTSYGYNGNEYVYYYVATPNKENNGNDKTLIIIIVVVSVVFIIIVAVLIIMMFNMKKKNLLRVVNDISFKADKDDEESDHASDLLIN